MNAKIAIFSTILRNEKEVHRAIQSVLEQTYRDFNFYILAGLQTLQLIQQYAVNDERIIIIPHKNQDANKEFTVILDSIIKEEHQFFTTLDADDWWETDYLETLLHFMAEEKLEIAACGINFWNYSCKQIDGVRNLNYTLIWNKDENSKYFSFYYGFFRPIWGKLFSIDVLKRMDFSELPSTASNGGYGGDTIFCLLALKNSKQSGILAKTLYHYQKNKAGTSSVLKEGRLQSDMMLFQAGKKFLSNYDSISLQNLEFLFQVYGYAMIDTLNLIKRQTLPDREKLILVETVLSARESKDLICMEQKKQGDAKWKFREIFFMLVFKDFFKNLEESEGRICFEIYASLYPKQAEILEFSGFLYLFNEKSILFEWTRGNFYPAFAYIISNFYKKELCEKYNLTRLLPETAKTLIVKAHISNYDFVIRYSEIFLLLEQEKSSEALEKIADILLHSNPVSFAVELTELLINIAAYLENQDAFIIGKIYKTEFLITQNRYEEAKKEYRDLQELKIESDLMEKIEYELYGNKSL